GLERLQHLAQGAPFRALEAEVARDVRLLGLARLAQEGEHGVAVGETLQGRAAWRPGHAPSLAVQGQRAKGPAGPARAPRRSAAIEFRDGAGQSGAMMRGFDLPQLFLSSTGRVGRLPFALAVAVLMVLLGLWRVLVPAPAW